MTICEYLNINEESFNYFQKRGMIKQNAIRDFEIYQYYIKEREKHGSMQAYTNASEKFFLSESSIQSIVYKQKEIYNAGNKEKESRQTEKV